MLKHNFDLQLFAEDEGLSFDAALSVLNGSGDEAPEGEAAVQEPQGGESAEQSGEQSAQADEQQGESDEQPTDGSEQHQAEQPPAVDYSAKVKFKANGQEMELSIQELIARAQMGENYNQKMQELANQRKAMEQQANVEPQNQPETQAEKIAKREQQIAEFANVFKARYGIEFSPWEPAHVLEMMDYYNEKAATEREQKAAETAQVREYEEMEQSYHSVYQEAAANPDFQEVNKFAEQALFQLPQKGPDGLQEFNVLYGAYQKIMERDRYFAEMQQFGQSQVRPQPFTRKEVDSLNKFYKQCAADFATKKQQEQVKAQVPKSAPIKPTVKMESTVPEPAQQKQIDFNKVRNMSIDEVVNLL